MARGLKVGDTVAWHHRLAATVESARRSTLPCGVDAPGPTPVGVIVGVANEEGTHFSVKFEGDTKPKDLTFEELLLVVED